MAIRHFLKKGVLLGTLIVASCNSVATKPLAHLKAERAPWRLSEVSGLPVPGRTTYDQPVGREANLTVLDWAGFEGAASYSFDDTQPSQVAHWPQLRDTGVRMTFYVWSNVAAQSVETWKDVVANGSELGNHTVTHKHVNELTSVYPGLDVADAAAQELDICDDFILSMGQKGVWTMAYPYGDLAWRHFLGDRYLAARTVSGGMVGAEGERATDATPNFLVTAGQTAETFDQALDDAANARSWVVFTFHALLPTTQNWYAGVEVAEVLASLGYGKDQGRVWLDSVANVAAYRQASQWLRQTASTNRGKVRTWSWNLPKGFPRGKYLRVTTGGGRLFQAGAALPWNEAGFYEVALDAESLTWQPNP